MPLELAPFFPLFPGLMPMAPFLLLFPGFMPLFFPFWACLPMPFLPFAGGAELLVLLTLVSESELESELESDSGPDAPMQSNAVKLCSKTWLCSDTLSTVADGILC